MPHCLFAAFDVEHGRTMLGRLVQQMPDVMEVRPHHVNTFNTSTKVLDP